MKFIDIKGNTYGSLYVKESVMVGTRQQWLCVCVCGKEVTKPGFQLRAGRTLSCGCQNTPVQIGQVYGHLTVIERLPNEVYGAKGMTRPVFKCKCSCEREIPVYSHYLVRGTATDCGCRLSEKLAENRRGEYGVSVRNYIISTYRSNAKRKDLDFEISDEEMIVMFQQDCHFCGRPPHNTVTKKHAYGSYTYNGIDRLDPSRGYVAGNVVSCCKTCNYLKNGYTEDEFKEIILRIANHISH